MKKNNILFFLLILLTGMAMGQDYSFKRKINGYSEEGWYSIPLTSDIFPRLKNDLSDLRVLAISGSDTTEIPYLLKVNEDEIKEETIQLPVINESKKNGKLFLTFELSNNKKVNYLDLQFAQNNFYAFVKLEGSHDQREWFVLTEKERILSIQNDAADYKVSTINFPVTNYRYLKASITSDNPLTFQSASFKDVQVTKGLFNTYPSSFTVHQNKKEKQTIVDIRFNQLVPVSRLSIDIESALDYYRRFNLEYVTDSAQTQKGWIKVYEEFYNGYLTSFNPNTINEHYALAKELRLTIYNLDNSPLTIKNVEVAGPVIELLAPLKPGEVFLFYGSDQGTMPSYDLSYFRAKIPEAKNTVTLGEEEYLTKPKTTASPLFENKVWLWAIMLLTVGVLGFFTLRMMKSKGPVTG